jgi:L-alanine-DL-glutamate epimerase-like enolase superfamily enzyme
VPTRAQTPDELGDQLARCVANGYRAVKFHILQPDPDHVIAETRQDFRIVDSRVQLTTRPGLGLEFDQAFLARHRTGVIT